MPDDLEVPPNKKVQEIYQELVKKAWKPIKGMFFRKRIDNHIDSLLKEIAYLKAENEMQWDLIKYLRKNLEKLNEQ